MRNFLWLFSAYRDLFFENQALRAEAKTQEALYLHIEQQLRDLMAAPGRIDSLMQTFKDTVLVEEPFPDGKIPDKLWLTPGENDR